MSGDQTNLQRRSMTGGNSRAREVPAKAPTKEMNSARCGINSAIRPGNDQIKKRVLI